MNDPNPGPDRRERRNARRRAQIRIAAAVAGVAAVAGAFVVLATDSVRIGGAGQPSFGATARVEATTTTTAELASCRPLTVADPLRLWVGGDSLAGSLGPALGTLAAATGVVQPYFDSRVSSGLSNPGFFDWPAQATTELARIDPEIVVFWMGTNDYGYVSDATKADYAQRVEKMYSALAGTGRTVIWVGAPVLRDEQMDAGAQRANAVIASVVKSHGASWFDAHKFFADPDGRFTTSLPDDTGKTVAMRTGDGVHLTTAGADYLAKAVYKLVDARCSVTAQAQPGVTKPVIETEGSTQVAPGSGSGNTPLQTTPPATTLKPAPSTTHPPVTTTPPTTAPATSTPTTAPTSTTVTTPPPTKG